MKATYSIATVVAILSAMFSLPAASVGRVAEPSCAQVICLSPADNQPPPQYCLQVRQRYFVIRVYDPSYDADATSAARQAFLSTCTSARPMDIQKITNKYGKLPDDPIVR